MGLPTLRFAAFRQPHITALFMTKKIPKKIDRPGLDKYGRSELHYAAAEKDLRKVSSLLSEGLDINAKDDDGRSPLHFATQTDSIEVVSKLLSAGANVNAADANGNSPLSNAVFNSRGKGEIINLLRHAGANSYEENRHGISPISLARSISNFDVAQFFNDLP